MKDDDRPLFVLCFGSTTDLASALLMEPQIADRLTAVSTIGGVYPTGGNEFNLRMDINAANVVFDSGTTVWQIPENVYKECAVSLAELQYKVEPYGKIGHYLFEQMIDLNDAMAEYEWPHGEMWGIGDNATIAALLQEDFKQDNWHEIQAPQFDPETMEYIEGAGKSTVRVYDSIDARLVLEDLFARLAICYPEADSQ